MSVFLADIRRTTRRGRPALLRTGYAVALLAALAIVFARWFGVGRLAPGEWFAPAAALPIRDVADFAREFAAACFGVQLAAVLLITPAFTAGAIAEERQRRTLDDLLITGLSSRRIVFGKMLARWVQVIAVLAAGLPVLFAAMSWGGLDLVQLVAGFVVSALYALVATAFGLWSSVEQRTVNGAVFVAYCLTLPILGYGMVVGGAAAAAALLGERAADAEVLAAFATLCLFLVGLAAGIAWISARRLRLTDLARVEDWPHPPKRRWPIPFGRLAPRPQAIPFVRAAPPIPSDVVPGDEDEPLLWRKHDSAAPRVATR